MPFIRCPTCNARYKVSAEASGKSAECQKCGQSFQIPELKPPPASGAESRPTDLSTPAGSDFIELEGPPPPAAPPAIAGPALEAVPISGAVTYAAGPAGVEAAAARGAYGGYLRALGRTLAFPAQPGNLITYLIVCLFMVISAALGLFGFFCLPILVSLIVAAWYMSFQFNVVLDAAAGEDDLPSLNFMSGLYEELVLPFSQMLVANLAARLPALLCLIGVSNLQGANPVAIIAWSVGFLAGRFPLFLSLPNTVGQVVSGVLWVMGMFLWPMFILIVAVGGIPGLVRFGLIGTTIARSFPAYWLVVLVVFAAQAIAFGSRLLLSALGSGVVGTGRSLSLLLLLALAGVLIEVYVGIVAMRAIGLYYHYFKHKFAWSWG